MGTDQHAAVTGGDETPCCVGDQLRQARERKSLSLEAAAEATKISKQYLKAMESDAYEQLPGPAYLHGFLKTYAAYLGLPAEELARQAGCVTAHQAETVAGSARGLNLRRYRWELLLLPLALLGALLVSTLFQTDHSPPSFRTLQSPDNQPPAQPAVSAAIQQPVSSSAAALPVQPASPAAEKPEAAPAHDDSGAQPSGVLVRMRVRRDSTVSVSIDDAASQAYELMGGDLIEWKAQRTIALDLSDQGSVEIELNGKPLRLQDAPGKSAYLVLDAHGLKK